MNTEIARLKKAFLFQGLPDDILKVLAQKVTHQKLPKDTTLFRQGDEGNALYIIDEGWVKIVREDERGSELVLNRCGPGEAIGEMSLFDQEPRSAGIVALTDAAVLELKREALFDLLDQRPDVAMILIRTFSSRLRFASTYLQKATEWSQKIAEGDYSFMEQIQSAQAGQSGSDEDRANELLAAFFQMVKGVKAREENLKQQVQKLTFAIDEARRKQEFEELTSTDFYSNLKAQAKKIREQRTDKQ
jgi:CRP-like cAMP-binding protein